MLAPRSRSEQQDDHGQPACGAECVLQQLGQPDRLELHAYVAEAAADAGSSGSSTPRSSGRGPACTHTLGWDHWHTDQRIWLGRARRLAASGAQLKGPPGEAYLKGRGCHPYAVQAVRPTPSSLLLIERGTASLLGAQVVLLGRRHSGRLTPSAGLDTSRRDRTKPRCKGIATRRSWARTASAAGSDGIAAMNRT